MPNQREPINLLLLKGKKHLTQEEIAARQASEVTAPGGNAKPPGYLNAGQRAEFLELAEQLAALNILGDIDAGELGRYVVAHSMYARYAKLLRTLPKKKAARLRELRVKTAEEAGRKVGPGEELDDTEVLLELEKSLTTLLDKFFGQCEQTARALGLNITSRCRLVVPTAPPAPKNNKFDRFKKTEADTG